MPLKKYIRAPVEEVPSIKEKLAFFEQQGREVVYGAMIPDPDYSDEERDTNKPTATTMVERNNQVNSTGGQDGRARSDYAQAVNPCLESSKKNLHRELMFNQKRGVNLLNQKSELQKAMEKHNDKKVLKEQEKEKQASLTPFQKALDERAHKIEQMEKAENKDEINDKTPPSCEFEKIHAKLRAKMETCMVELADVFDSPGGRETVYKVMGEEE
ncbi:protein FAM107B-like, partial [Homarus americanus]